MTDILTNLGDLFEFLISQLGLVANFFTSSTIGQIILGIGIFSVVVTFIVSLINKKF